MDSEKLKYDLAMQCATAKVTSAIITKKITNDIEIRNAILEEFKGFYMFYNAMCEDNFKYIT